MKRIIAVDRRRTCRRVGRLSDGDIYQAVGGAVCRHLNRAGARCRTGIGGVCAGDGTGIRSTSSGRDRQPVGARCDCGPPGDGAGAGLDTLKVVLPASFVTVRLRGEITKLPNDPDCPPRTART